MSAAISIGHVCVYCGSSQGKRAEYMAAARDLGRSLAVARIGLVFGGTDVGLMGAVADEVLTHGGEVTGVITEALHGKGIGHRALTRLEVVTDMHARKARMAELADGFVALPGGYGTWEELCEVLTWTQLGVHAKPAVILEVAGFWAPFVAFVAHASSEGFVKAAHRDLLRVAHSPEGVITELRRPLPPLTSKWD